MTLQADIKCPLCGRDAFFRYAGDGERLRGSPLCWGEREADCPGYEQWRANNQSRDVQKVGV